MKKLASLLALHLFAFTISSALADDDDDDALSGIELQVAPSLQIDYKPFSGLPSSESLQLELRLEDQDDDDDDDDDDDLDDDDFQNSVQSLIIRFRPADQGAFNAVGEQLQLPVIMTSTTNQPLESINNEYRHQINIDLSSSEPETFDYSLSILESLYADKGSYFLYLDVELLDPVTEEIIGVTQSVEVEVVVNAKLQTNIAGTQGSYEDGTNFAVIDFETLETGEMKRVFIQVRGNTPAELTVSSENDGRMQNTKRSDLYVDYSVEVDGVYSTLEQPLKLARTVARDLQGSAYPMEVTIGDVESSFSGNYQDIIHVDVNPQ